MYKLFEPVAVYKKEDDGSYFAYCPTIEGVFSEGETLEEARNNIKEALEGVIESVIERDQEYYFTNKTHKKKKGEIVEPIELDKKLQIAVSIRIAREAAGLKQKEVAEMLKITQQSVSRYEKGIVTPKAEIFLKLVEI